MVAKGNREPGIRGGKSELPPDIRAGLAGRAHPKKQEWDLAERRFWNVFNSPRLWLITAGRLRTEWWKFP